jgi:hypothetical protein
MGVQYKIESNKENKLTERTFYKKGAEFLIIEETKKEFNIITESRPRVGREQGTNFIELSEFQNNLHSNPIRKFIFSSSVTKEDQNTIKKLLKNSGNYELQKKGWIFFDKSTKIFGRSDVMTISFNRIEFSGISFKEVYVMDITKENFKKYLKEGITDSELDLEEISINGFCDSSIQLEINGEEYDIEYELEELIDSKSKDIASHFSKLQIVREVDYKNGKCFIEIYEEFNPEKFGISSKNFIIGKNKKFVNTIYVPTYNGETFYLEDCGKYMQDEFYLIDEKGNIHSLEFKDEDSDEESEDE